MNSDLIHPDIVLRSLRRHQDPQLRAAAICDIAARQTRSPLAAYYSTYKQTVKQRNLRRLGLTSHIGFIRLPESLAMESEVFDVITLGEKAAVRNSEEGPFEEIILQSTMRSGMAVLIDEGKGLSGVLIVNHNAPFHYTGDYIRVFEQLAQLACCIQGGVDG